MGSIQLINLATVEQNTQICADHHLIILKDNGVTSAATRPGQFVNLVIPQRPDLFLRRPFSVAKTDPEKNLLYIVYRIVGEGTEAMSELKPGIKVDLMGPLGVGWHLPESPGNSLLIGGGCGVAPLWGLAEYIADKGGRVYTVLGFQSEDKVFGEDVFKAVEADITVTTDDGSYGEAGFVCDHLEASLDQSIDRAYVCGPMPMVKTVIPKLLENDIEGEVSLEEIMGCGFGVCLSCVTEIEQDGRIEKQRICTEGPVFSIKEVKW
ncbi:MAG: dihydroorotate dehydrogenase electron transfer subunit [Desulfobulbaceae bacterium]|nr:MAG: dihydroorotate dehydrogenase electron transfer subunit [Desulfobulbaceae bacterium]